MPGLQGHLKFSFTGGQKNRNRAFPLLRVQLLQKAVCDRQLLPLRRRLARFRRSQRARTDLEQAKRVRERLSRKSFTCRFENDCLAALTMNANCKEIMRHND